MKNSNNKLILCFSFLPTQSIYHTYFLVLVEKTSNNDELETYMNCLTHIRELELMCL